MNSLTESLNAHAPNILRWIAGFELQITVLAALVWLLDRWLRRSSPMLRYSLWLIVLAKAFIPPFIYMPVVRIPIEVFKASPMLAAGVETATAATITTSSALHTHPANAPALSMWSWVLLVWVLCALILLCVAVWRTAALHCRLRGAVEVTGRSDKSDGSDNSDESDKFVNLSWEGASHKPRVFVTDAIDTPLTTGFFRPKIYLTPELTASESAALQSVLQHELAHVRRQDLWIVFLQNLASVLHPVNPLMRLMNTKLHQYREMICDEHALRVSRIDARMYGELLLDLIERKISAPKFTASAMYFFETKKGMKQRIRRIANFCESNASRFRPRHYALVFVLCIALVPMSWQCKKEAPVPSHIFFSIEKITTLTDCDSVPRLISDDSMSLDPISRAMESATQRTPRRDLNEEFLFKIGIDAKGAVQSVKTIKGFNSRSIDLFLQAIPQAHWSPAQKSGLPVAAEILLPLKYSIAMKGDLEHQRTPQYDTPPAPVGGMDALYNALVYPDEAIAKGIQGTVVLQVTVLSNSWVDKVLVVSSPDEELSKAAKKAVQSISWKPAMYKDKPISWADVKVPLEFKLQASDRERKN